MTWIQKTLRLRARSRGFHLVTDEFIGAIQSDLRQISVGLCHCFIQHSSAALALNENADPDVRGDLERWFEHNVRRNEPYYVHTYEGPDDMPAHIASLLIGESLTIPITGGQLNLGTWQGIYLCERRDHASSRSVVVTIQGE